MGIKFTFYKELQNAKPQELKLNYIPQLQGLDFYKNIWKLPKLFIQILEDNMQDTETCTRRQEQELTLSVL